MALGIVSWIANTIANGIAVKMTSDILEKGQANLGKSLSFTLSRLMSLLAVAIVTSILTIIGVICLLVPGIILAIMFSLVVPAIMIEGTGALDSLGRSRRPVGKR